MLSMDGEKIWADFASALPASDRKHFHRINPTVNHHELEIDNVDLIAKVRTRTLQDPRTGFRLRAVLASVWSSLFYLELDRMPSITGRQVVCDGFIYCRLHLQHPQALTDVLSSAQFLVNGEECACIGGQDIAHPTFRKPVQIVTSHISSTIRVQIRVPDRTLGMQDISGMPTTPDRLLRAQLMYSPFGRADHRPPEKPLPPLPTSKRKATSMEKSGDT